MALAMPEFRRQACLHQEQWRAAHGHPMGTQPIVPQPGKPARPVGTRLPLDYARATGANFLTPAALAAVQGREANKEPQQSRDAQRTWADLLWRTTLAYNLFGDLADDLRRADRAVHTWWPDAPGVVSAVRFEYSPGRLDTAYTGSLVDLDTAFVLDLDDGSHGIIGLHVVYHDALKLHTPKPERFAHYAKVAKRSGVFGRGAIARVNTRSDLLVMFLGHLLVLSMLQQRSRDYSWARFAVIYPEGNTDYADACDRYRALLADEASFDAMTVEAVVRSGVLPRPSARALRERYLGY